MIIDRYEAVPEDLESRLWPLYEAAFRDVDTLAAQRHLLDRAEFAAILADKRIATFVARDDVGPAGVAVMTNVLEAWPLVSPRFFARRWPDHYRRGAVWYFGFVAVDPVWAGRGYVFAQLIAAMQPTVGRHGIAVMDFCAYNSQVRGLPAASGAVLRRIDPQARLEQVDVQEFWAVRFDGTAP